MNFVLTPEDYITTEWSGGKTTELFIYPPRASFKGQDYDIRLSTATVEVNESTFTPLPNVDRTLIVLEGELTLDHKGEHSSQLKKFDVDHFKGGWLTTSKGKCVDFNLMIRSNNEGRISGIKLEEGEHKIYALDESDKMNFVYLIKGTLSVQTEKGDFILNQENLLVLETVRKVRFSSVNPVEFLIITVKTVNNR
jgi:environmental stress-induced protein Ves